MVDPCEFNLYPKSYSIERENGVKRWSACICDCGRFVGRRLLSHCAPTGAAASSTGVRVAQEGVECEASLA